MGQELLFNSIGSTDWSSIAILLQAISSFAGVLCICVGASGEYDRTLQDGSRALTEEDFFGGKTLKPRPAMVFTVPSQSWDHTDEEFSLEFLICVKEEEAARIAAEDDLWDRLDAGKHPARSLAQYMRIV